jgi:hypothetical protein
MIRTLLRHLNDESGHAGALPAALVGAAGAVTLGLAVAGDIGWLAIVSGVIVGGSILAMPVMNHIFVEYEFYRRLEKLEER